MNQSQEIADMLNEYLKHFQTEEAEAKAALAAIRIQERESIAIASQKLIITLAKEIGDILSGEKANNGKEKEKENDTGTLKEGKRRSDKEVANGNKSAETGSAADYSAAAGIAKEILVKQ